MVISQKRLEYIFLFGAVKNIFPSSENLPRDCEESVLFVVPEILGGYDDICLRHAVHDGHMSPFPSPERYKVSGSDGIEIRLDETHLLPVLEPMFGISIGPDGCEIYIESGVQIPPDELHTLVLESQICTGQIICIRSLYMETIPIREDFKGHPIYMDRTESGTIWERKVEDIMHGTVWKTGSIFVPFSRENVFLQAK